MPHRRGYRNLKGLLPHAEVRIRHFLDPPGSRVQTNPTTEDLATHQSLGSDRPCLWLAIHDGSGAVWMATTKVLIRIGDSRLLGEESQLEEDGAVME